MSERVWIAPGRADDRRTSYDRLLTLARAEAEAGAAHLKVRTARWRGWQRCFPLHRMRWSLREARALGALREAGVPAVEPWLAGARIGARSGEAFLATRRYAGLDLELALVQRAAPARWCEALAALVAQLHRAGFAHRDLFLRNVLASGAELRLLDAHRTYRPHLRPWGAPRGYAYDLACLDLDLAALAAPSERNLFWSSYRVHSDSAPADGPLRSRVERRQREIVRRFSAKRPEARAARLERMGLSLEELLERWARR